jgi:hypothetical protein
LLETVPLAGILGFETITEDQPSRDHLALELHAEGGRNVLEFTCAGIAHVVRSSVLHKITANAMKLTAIEKFTASKGKQKLDRFAGGTSGEHVLEESENGNPFQRVGLSLSATLTNEEKVEASTVN